MRQKGLPQEQEAVTETIGASKFTVASNKSCRFEPLVLLMIGCCIWRSSRFGSKHLFRLGYLTLYLPEQFLRRLSCAEVFWPIVLVEACPMKHLEETLAHEQSTLIIDL
jgi:hypothetical protein